MFCPCIVPYLLSSTLLILDCYPIPLLWLPYINLKIFIDFSWLWSLIMTMILSFCCSYNGNDLWCVCNWHSSSDFWCLIYGLGLSLMATYWWFDLTVMIHIIHKLDLISRQLTSIIVYFSNVLVWNDFRWLR